MLLLLPGFRFGRLVAGWCSYGLSSSVGAVFRRVDGLESVVDLAGDVAFELSWSSRCGEELFGSVS